MSIPAGEAQATLECHRCHGTTNGTTNDNRPQDTHSGDNTLRNINTGAFQGNHQNHMVMGATGQTCSKCHPGSEQYNSAHRDGKITLANVINGSPNPTSYGKGLFFNQTSIPDLSNAKCSNVNCHFESPTDTWGTAPFSNDTTKCNKCHGAPPKDGGQHPLQSDGITPTKHGNYLGTGVNSCSYCHADHTADPNNFAHALSTGQRPLIVKFKKFDRFPNATGHYTSYENLNYPNYLLPSSSLTRNGACIDTYCHSNGTGGAPTETLTWSDSKDSRCFSCHKGIVAENKPDNCTRIAGSWTNVTNPVTGEDNVGVCTPFLTMSSNGHQRLVGPQWVRQYPCTYCHNATVNALGNITSVTKHVMNGQPDVAIDSKWNIVNVNYSAPRYNPVTKVCSNVYCHSDGTSDPGAIKPFPWNKRNPQGNKERAQCNSCHGHPIGECNECHNGSKVVVIKGVPTVLSVYSGWTSGEEWKSAMPMFPNEGPGSLRANSHPRHNMTNFTCDICHMRTIIPDPSGAGCTTTSCHRSGTFSSNTMGEVAHINADLHINKISDVKFKNNSTNATYDNRIGYKTCSSTSTRCHGENKPKWGDSVNNTVTCDGCHGSSGSSATDTDIYATFGNHSGPAKINKTQWVTSGHGRTAGFYPESNNPAANFPGVNACWYCHDNKILHGDASNRFRLRSHKQFENRFEKECVYCHMERKNGTDDTECRNCHNVTSGESMAPQLLNISSSGTRIASWADNSSVGFKRPDHREYSGSTTPSCLATSSGGIPCHYVNPATPQNDGHLHNTGAGVWSAFLKDDIRNQYVKMGVCLQCHDDDSANQCASCHGVKNASGNYVNTDGTENIGANRFKNISVPNKYKIGFDPKMEGSRFIKPTQARASGSHFGYKHFRQYQKDGVWRGGKFCWNCHDPHGDSNIYMINDNVATTTDARQGFPLTTKRVRFNKKIALAIVNSADYVPGYNGALNGQYGYARKNGTAVFDGICNVCHMETNHYKYNSGDTHNSTRPCTECHEHRFTDSHADDQTCNSCHKNSKPVPKHTAFGQPRDCTKCHASVVNSSRMNIMRQMSGNSHHVQGIPVKNKHCYACHWEATKDGIINKAYHEGYNYKLYTSVKGAKVDLVVWKANGVRPTYYNTTTSIQYLASRIGTLDERAEVGKITNHCLGCHSDQNNNTDPFGDCKTPRQYAWDRSSVKARYDQTGTTEWGKYATNGKSVLTKAFSAHGKPELNQGGWSTQTGVDSAIPITRGYSTAAGKARAVQCYDCHNSHGSTTTGITSSYVTFNNTRNGANLKETSAGMGGYANTYKAYANPATVAINPYNAGAGQCFDCHLSRNVGTALEPILLGEVSVTYRTPWGYNSTFAAISSIRGFKDSDRFGNAGVMSGHRAKLSYKAPNSKSGHLKVSIPLGNYTTSATNRINGLCTPCHDPHGVSPTLGNADQAYSVPLLKGTWLTSPYKEDLPETGSPGQYNGGSTLQQYRPVTPNVYTDAKTFGAGNSISEDATKFAGVCMRCHLKSKLTKDACSKPEYHDSTTCTANGGVWSPNPWKSVERVHEAVKGWKTSNTTLQHQYSCSKCHVPHSSSLPRLMQTNCLDAKHRGRAVSSGIPQQNVADRGVDNGWTRFAGGGFPKGTNVNYGAMSMSARKCHPTPDADGWDNNRWNDKTPW